MKEAFFNWLSGLGVEVTSLMALVIALGFIVITSFGSGESNERGVF